MYYASSRASLCPPAVPWGCGADVVPLDEAHARPRRLSPASLKQLYELLEVGESVGRVVKEELERVKQVRRARVPKAQRGMRQPRAGADGAGLVVVDESSPSAVKGASAAAGSLNWPEAFLPVAEVRSANPLYGLDEVAEFWDDHKRQQMQAEMPRVPLASSPHSPRRRLSAGDACCGNSATSVGNVAYPAEKTGDEVTKHGKHLLLAKRVQLQAQQVLSSMPVRDLALNRALIREQQAAKIQLILGRQYNLVKEISLLMEEDMDVEQILDEEDERLRREQIRSSFASSTIAADGNATVSSDAASSRACTTVVAAEAGRADASSCQSVADSTVRHRPQKSLHPARDLSLASIREVVNRLEDIKKREQSHHGGTRHAVSTTQGIGEDPLTHGPNHAQLLAFQARHERFLRLLQEHQTGQGFLSQFHAIQMLVEETLDIVAREGSDGDGDRVGKEWHKAGGYRYSTCVSPGRRKWGERFPGRVADGHPSAPASADDMEYFATFGGYGGAFARIRIANNLLQSKAEEKARANMANGAPLGNHLKDGHPRDGADASVAMVAFNVLDEEERAAEVARRKKRLMHEQAGHSGDANYIGSADLSWIDVDGNLAADAEEESDQYIKLLDFMWKAVRSSRQELLRLARANGGDVPPTDALIADVTSEPSSEDENEVAPSDVNGQGETPRAKPTVNVVVRTNAAVTPVRTVKFTPSSPPAPIAPKEKKAKISSSSRSSSSWTSSSHGASYESGDAALNFELAAPFLRSVKEMNLSEDHLAQLKALYPQFSYEAYLESQRRARSSRKTEEDYILEMQKKIDALNRRRMTEEAKLAPQAVDELDELLRTKPPSRATTPVHEVAKSPLTPFSSVGALLPDGGGSDVASSPVSTESICSDTNNSALIEGITGTRKPTAVGSASNSSSVAGESLAKMSKFNRNSLRASTQRKAAARKRGTVGASGRGSSGTCMANEQASLKQDSKLKSSKNSASSSLPRPVKVLLKRQVLPNGVQCTLYGSSVVPGATLASEYDEISLWVVNDSSVVEPAPSVTVRINQHRLQNATMTMGNGLQATSSGEIRVQVPSLAKICVVTLRSDSPATELQYELECAPGSGGVRKASQTAIFAYPPSVTPPEGEVEVPPEGVGSNDSIEPVLKRLSATVGFANFDSENLSSFLSAVTLESSVQQLMKRRRNQSLNSGSALVSGTEPPRSPRDGAGASVTVPPQRVSYISEQTVHGASLRSDDHSYEDHTRAGSPMHEGNSASAHNEAASSSPVPDGSVPVFIGDAAVSAGSNVMNTDAEFDASGNSASLPHSPSLGPLFVSSVLEADRQGADVNYLSTFLSQDEAAESPAPLVDWNPENVVVSALLLGTGEVQEAPVSAPQEVGNGIAPGVQRPKPSAGSVSSMDVRADASTASKRDQDKLDEAVHDFLAFCFAEEDALAADSAEEDEGQRAATKTKKKKKRTRKGRATAESLVLAALQRVAEEERMIINSLAKNSMTISKEAQKRSSSTELRPQVRRKYKPSASMASAKSLAQKDSHAVRDSVTKRAQSSAKEDRRASDLASTTCASATLNSQLDSSAAGVPRPLTSRQPGPPLRPLPSPGSSERGRKWHPMDFSRMYRQPTNPSGVTEDDAEAWSRPTSAQVVTHHHGLPPYVHRHARGPSARKDGPPEPLERDLKKASDSGLSSDNPEAASMGASLGDSRAQRPPTSTAEKGGDLGKEHPEASLSSRMHVASGDEEAPIALDSMLLSVMPLVPQVRTSSRPKSGVNLSDSASLTSKMMSSSSMWQPSRLPSHLRSQSASVVKGHSRNFSAPPHRGRDPELSVCKIEVESPEVQSCVSQLVSAIQWAQDASTVPFAKFKLSESSSTRLYDSPFGACLSEMTALEENARELFRQDPVMYDRVIDELVKRVAKDLDSMDSESSTDSSDSDVTNEPPTTESAGTFRFPQEAAFSATQNDFFQRGYRESEARSDGSQSRSPNYLSETKSRNDSHFQQKMRQRGSSMATMQQRASESDRFVTRTVLTTADATYNEKWMLDKAERRDSTIEREKENVRRLFRKQQRTKEVMLTVVEEMYDLWSNQCREVENFAQQAAIRYAYVARHRTMKSLHVVALELSWAFEKRRLLDVNKLVAILDRKLKRRSPRSWTTGDTFRRLAGADSDFYTDQYQFLPRNTVELNKVLPSKPIPLRDSKLSAHLRLDRPWPLLYYPLLVEKRRKQRTQLPGDPDFDVAAAREPRTAADGGVVENTVEHSGECWHLAEPSSPRSMAFFRRGKRQIPPTLSRKPLSLADAGPLKPISVPLSNWKLGVSDRQRDSDVLTAFFDRIPHAPGRTERGSRVAAGSAVPMRLFPRIEPVRPSTVRNGSSTAPFHRSDVRLLPLAPTGAIHAVEDEKGSSTSASAMARKKQIERWTKNLAQPAM